MEWREVELNSGVVGFDGDVVEAFGFTTGNSQRMPVTTIKRIDDAGGTITIHSGVGNIAPLVIPLGGDDADNARFKDLLELIRGNAMNLEE